MKLGSLFDGIGGFPLAGLRSAVMPVWASEVEPFLIEVSKKHFPDMKHLGDITKINGAEIEPVDIITAGSPCQDLSIAGKREGLKGERSGLFMEFVRIVREMRNATAGQYPRFIIWENVPGAFSSNKGRDFRAVLEEITQAEIPMPKSGRWAPAGMVRGQGYSVAWRVLDAQYWGVPQRRRRIFLVADFTGQRAPEILFEREGVHGDTPEGRKARQEVTENVRDGTEKTRYWDGGQISDTLDCSVISKQQAMPEKRRFAAVLTQQIHPKVTCTLCASAAGLSRPAGMGNELDLCIAFGPGSKTNISHAVRAQASRADKPSSTTYVCKIAPTVPARERGGGGLGTDFDCDGGLVKEGYAVRRLTPIECLRLQGFPDNWFDGVPGASDTASYKAVGNSVAQPPLEWIFKQITNAVKCEV